MSDQPSEMQEIANAAYTWRLKVQEDLVQAMRDKSVDLDEAEYWFERFRRAYKREIRTQEFAYSKPSKTQKG